MWYLHEINSFAERSKILADQKSNFVELLK